MTPQLTSAFLLACLLAGVRAPPPPSEPPATYPNGTANPFYPCGYDHSSVAACKYRCYTSAGTLLPSCFAEAKAKQAISSGLICVKCSQPNAPRDYPGGCQSLRPYFNVSSSESRPSPCGVTGKELSNCAYVCGEAQVPFDVCSATDTSGQFSQCTQCTPQCSSPQIVFEPPNPPPNFSLSSGSCQSDKAYGKPARNACPYRCTKAGTPNAFCSLQNKIDANAFLNCTSCAG